MDVTVSFGVGHPPIEFADTAASSPTGFALLLYHGRTDYAASDGPPFIGSA